MRHILCPTDFSKSAARALEHALELASAFKADITLLHVYQPSAVRSTRPVGVRAGGDARSDAPNKLKAIDEIIAAHNNLPVTFHALVCDGPAWERIITQTDAIRADLIVIGRNGRAPSGMALQFKSQRSASTRRPRSTAA